MRELHFLSVIYISWLIHFLFLLFFFWWIVSLVSLLFSDARAWRSWSSSPLPITKLYHFNLKRLSFSSPRCTEGSSSSNAAAEDDKAVGEETKAWQSSVQFDSYWSWYNLNVIMCFFWHFITDAVWIHKEGCVTNWACSYRSWCWSKERIRGTTIVLFNFFTTYLSTIALDDGH